MLSSLVVALLVAGCAKRPNAVVPANLPSETYANYSCKQLGQLLVSEKANEKTLTSKQRGAADADAIGIFLVGSPLQAYWVEMWKGSSPLRREKSYPSNHKG
ncbi:MAG: hypothetical protein ABJN11_09980 [Lentilitoribacter sp.]